MGYQAATAPAAPETRLPGADDFVTNPAEATQRYLEHVRQTQFVPALESRDAALASQARMLAEMRYGDEFRRWGPEIDILAQQVPTQNRSADAFKMIVEVVRSRHVDELVNEKADARLKQLVETGQMRPQTAAGAAPTAGTAAVVDLDKLPPNYSRRLRDLGITSDLLDESLRSMYPGMPISDARKKWFDLASKGDVITDGRSITYEGASNG